MCRLGRNLGGGGGVWDGRGGLGKGQFRPTRSPDQAPAPGPSESIERKKPGPSSQCHGMARSLCTGVEYMKTWRGQGGRGGPWKCQSGQQHACSSSIAHGTQSSSHLLERAALGPPKRQIHILAPSPCECDLTWKKDLCKCN